MKAPLMLALATAVLAGCKVQMSTTTGGSITTSSGNFSCTGSPCTSVDVSDLEFDETFMAQADTGYRFVGWRKKHRGLCGGSTDACRLFTAGFAGDSLLLSFLDRDDEVFFLEAVFAEDTGAGSGSGVGNASSCWNDALVTPGTTLVASYQGTNALGESLDYHMDQIVEGGYTFNGKNALRATSNVYSTGDYPSTGITKSYFQLPGGQRMRSLGVETEILSPSTGTSVTTYAPFELQRFDLAAGQSFSTSFETSTDTQVAGQTSATTVAEERTITFDGIESLTVPAGTFQACRFTVVRTSTSIVPAGNSRTYIDMEWYHVGTAVLLKHEEDDSLTELKSASVNGADI